MCAKHLFWKKLEKCSRTEWFTVAAWSLFSKNTLTRSTDYYSLLLVRRPCARVCVRFCLLLPRNNKFRSGQNARVNESEMHREDKPNSSGVFFTRKRFFITNNFFTRSAYSFTLFREFFYSLLQNAAKQETNKQTNPILAFYLSFLNRIILTQHTDALNNSAKRFSKRKYKFQVHVWI